MRDLESECGSPLAEGIEGSLAVFGFIAVETEVVVGIAVLPHALEGAGEFVGGGSDGLGRAEAWARMRRQNPPRAAWLLAADWAARRSAVATRLTTHRRRRRVCGILPPVMTGIRVAAQTLRG